MGQVRQLLSRAPRRARRLGLGLLVPALGLVAAAPAQAAPGHLSSSFGSGGIATAPAGTSFNAVAVQPDGKSVAVGSYVLNGASYLIVARYTVTGRLDPSFGGKGIVAGPGTGDATYPSAVARAVAIQPDGRIVVVGTATGGDGSGRGGIVVERFNANGSVDGSFGHGGVADLLSDQQADGYSVVLQGDGKILAGGSADANGSGNGLYPRVTVARLTAAGAPDTSFGGGSGTAVLDLGPYSYAYALAVQPDGKIVLAGSQSPGLQVVNALVARLTPAGALDTSFAGSGAVAKQYAQGAASSVFRAAGVEPNGTIVVAGSATRGSSAADAIVARFLGSGAADSSFGSGGVVYTPSAANYAAGQGTVPGANALALIANGDIVLAGAAANGVAGDAALWAFKPAGSLDGAFGSNGAALIGSTAGVNYSAAGLAVDPAGSLIVAGVGSTFGAASQGFLAELTGFGAPAVNPPGHPPGVAPLRAGLKPMPGTLRRSSLTRSGLPVTVTCNEACRITGTLTVPATTAKRLGLRVHGRAPVSIGRASGSLGGAGAKTLRLRVSGAVARGLAKLARTSVSLTVVVSPAGKGKRTTLRRSVTILR